MIDLVSNDVQRLDEHTINFMLYGVFSFLQLIVAAVLMAYLIGWQSLPGVIFFCLLLPYFAVLSHVGAKLRNHTALVSDCRISLMNQAVAGIRAIKTHSWEDEYRKKIKDARRYASHFSGMLWNYSICSKLKLPIGSIAVVFRRELT